ncbi:MULTISPECIES: SRPBCC family protein [Myxococcaceae]|uniref:SRPBCC family protein n=1 Tax=Myxococcaceae TaxID=31 RepID=UPI001E30BC87|nr:MULTISPECIES: SRPBCC family protein [Myxococcaceae]
MRRYVHETVVPTPAGKLYRALTDIARWPQWDAELASTEAPASLTRGAAFSLTPRGGPRVRMTVEEASAPASFTDVAHLPLARMRTRHDLLPCAEGTRVRVTIEVAGPLSLLWDRAVARKQAAGSEANTHALARFAEAQP